MQVNPVIMAIIAVVLVALVIFIVVRNKKDKDEFVEELNAEEDLSTLKKDDFEKQHDQTL